MPRRNLIPDRLTRIALALTTLASISLSAHGQVDCVDPNLIRVSRIQGHVFDPSGAPIPAAQVSLSQNNTIVATNQTGEAGGFSFRVPGGEYEIRIQAKGFDQLHFHVSSGNDVSSDFRKSDIRAILSIAHGSCSWATTSSKEFQQELKLSGRKYN